VPDRYRYRHHHRHRWRPSAFTFTHLHTHRRHARTNCQEFTARCASLWTAVTAEEYHHEFPDIYPDVQPPYTYPMQLSGREMDSMVDLWYNSGEAPEPREALRQKVKAILIVADPVPWGRDLQICMDLLRSDGHPDVRIDSQEVACYVSCCDFEYSSTWPVPRLGNGAFTIALDVSTTRATSRRLRVKC
jgi:hypothetical protein